MLAFQVDPTQLERALRTNAKGHLCLGPTAVSVEPADGLVCAREVRFRDYLMEGFVTYGLVRTDRDGELWLEVLPHGTNRDRYLRSHLRWLFTSAGIDVLAERDDDAHGGEAGT